MGRRGYPPEFRKVLDLVEAGRPIAEIAQALGISAQSIYTWRHQDRIDKGLLPASRSTSTPWSWGCAAPAWRGITGRPKFRRGLRPEATAADLVQRQFTRSGPNQLWVTDITEHPTREGKVYCAVVLDACSRRVVGWSIDATPTAALVTNALGMAIQPRKPAGGR
jgi:transposase InsO family protein